MGIPEGEVYKTLGRVGLDISDAISSAQKLDTKLKGLDRTFKSLAESARTAEQALRESLAIAFDPKGIQDMINVLGQANSSFSNMLKAQGANELKVLRQTEASKLNVIQASEKEIQNLRSAAQAEELRQRAAHNQKLIQLDQVARKAQERTLKQELEQRRRVSPISEAFGYRTSWFISGSIFYGFIRGAQSLIDTYADVEDMMVGLKKVMNDQAADFDSLRDHIFDTASAYGVLTQKAGEAAIEWARQGRTQAEVEKLLQPTLLLGNVAEIENTADAVGYLTAALKQFQMSVESANKVVDSWNEVSNNYAVTARSLADAVSIAGSVAHTTGVSFDEMIGHVTALSEATRKSGQEIGQSLKTIYAYILRPETIKTFESMGIKIKEDANNFRLMSEILAEVASKWNKLTEAQQYTLAMSAAGARRVSDFISLLRNYDTAIKATITSALAAGSAERENAKLMESYRKQVAQLHVELQRLSVTMGEAGLISILRGVVGGATSAVEAFNSLPPSIKSIISVLGELAAALTAANYAWTFFASKTLLADIGKGSALAGIKNLVTWLSNLHPVIKAVAVALGLGTTAYVAYNRVQKEAAEAQRKEANELKSLQEALKASDELLKKYKKGSAEYNQVMESRQKIINRIADITPQFVKATDKMGGAMEVLTDKLSKYIDKLEEMEKAEKLATKQMELEAVKRRINQIKQQLPVPTGPGAPADINAMLLPGGIKIDERGYITGKFAPGTEPSRVGDYLQNQLRDLEERAKALEKEIADIKSGKETPPPPGGDNDELGTTFSRFVADLMKSPLKEQLPIITEITTRIQTWDKALEDLERQQEKALIPFDKTTLESEKLSKQIEQVGQKTKLLSQASAEFVTWRSRVEEQIKSERKTINGLVNEYNNLQKAWAGKEKDEIPEQVKQRTKELEEQISEHSNIYNALQSMRQTLFNQEDRMNKAYNDSLLERMKLEKQLTDTIADENEERAKVNDQFRKDDRDAVKAFYDYRIEQEKRLASPGWGLRVLNLEKQKIDAQREIYQIEIDALERQKARANEIDKAAIDQQIESYRNKIQALAEEWKKIEAEYKEQAAEEGRIFDDLLGQVFNRIDAIVKDKMKDFSTLTDEEYARAVEKIRSQTIEEQTKKGIDQIMNSTYLTVEQQISKLYDLSRDAVRTLGDDAGIAVNLIGQELEKIYTQQASDALDALKNQFDSKVTPEYIKALEGLIDTFKAKGPEAAKAVQDISKELASANKELAETISSQYDDFLRTYASDLKTKLDAVAKDLREKFKDALEAGVISPAQFEEALKKETRAAIDAYVSEQMQGIDKMEDIVKQTKALNDLMLVVQVQAGDQATDAIGTITKKIDDLWTTYMGDSLKEIETYIRDFHERIGKLLDLSTQFQVYGTKNEKVMRQVNYQIGQAFEGFVKDELSRINSTFESGSKELADALFGLLTETKGQPLATPELIQEIEKQYTDVMAVLDEEAIRRHGEVQRAILETADRRIKGIQNSLSILKNEATGVGEAQANMAEQIKLTNDLMSAQESKATTLRTILEGYRESLLPKAPEEIRPYLEAVIEGRGTESDIEQLRLFKGGAPSVEEGIRQILEFNDDLAQTQVEIAGTRQEADKLARSLEGMKIEDFGTVMSAGTEALQQNLSKASKELQRAISELSDTKTVESLQKQIELHEQYAKDLLNERTQALMDFDVIVARFNQDFAKAVKPEIAEKYSKILDEVFMTYRKGEPLTVELAKQFDELRQEMEKSSGDEQIKALLGLLDVLQKLSQAIDEINGNISDTTRTTEGLKIEKILLPIQEQVNLLNAAISEMNKAFTDTAIASQIFGNYMFALSGKQLPYLQKQFEATKKVVDYYASSLQAVLDQLSKQGLTKEEMDLVRKAAVNGFETPEEIMAFQKFIEKHKQAGDVISLLIEQLLQLRDASGQANKSLVDQAFQIFQVTTEAQGLLEALQQMSSAYKELQGQFDSFDELQSLKGQFNFLNIFGNPVEMAREAWRHQFETIQREMSLVATIREARAKLISSQEDEKALGALKQALKEAYPELSKEIDAMDNFATVIELADQKIAGFGDRLRNLSQQDYFLRLAEQAEEAGKNIEQSLEQSFENLLTNLLSGKTDIKDMLIQFGQEIVNSFASMMAQGITTRIFGDPNNPNSIAGQIQQWATGQAQGFMGIQSGITQGGTIAAQTMYQNIVTAGQIVASQWATAITTSGNIAAAQLTLASPVGGGGGLQVPPLMLGGDAASSVSSASGAGGLLGLFKGFNPWLMIGTFALGAILQGMQRAQEVAPPPQEYYHANIHTMDFNPFGAPERVYRAGKGYEEKVVQDMRTYVNVPVINVYAQDGTDAGRKIWREVSKQAKAGSWRR